MRALWRWLAATLIVLSTTSASAGQDVVSWTRDPDLVPWETMTTSGDPDRTPARTRADLTRRRAAVRSYLDTGGRSPKERAAALVELGDLFRDEARLVLQQDAADPWRIPLRTSPAWLQLELALRWYDEAQRTDRGSVDADGRLTLLKAVLMSRLGQGDSFDESVQIIRSYRGTPYVEMAKLAVGDHHFRRGSLDKARTAYRLVRENRDPELSGYARYRLASVHAALGDADKARVILEDLLDDDSPRPLMVMLRDAARSALANHLASEQSLTELLPWLAKSCPPGDDACVRDLRAAAADTYASIGDDRADAWLRTVDASPPLASDLATRMALARRMLADEPVYDVLFAAEDACAPDDPMCLAEQAHAVASYYDEIADPDGGWLMEYVRLPRLADAPEVQRLMARIARAPERPEAELADMEALCDDDACVRRLHTHLRVCWGRLSRLHDAAWLHFVDEPPPVPGPPDAELAAGRLVRSRATAREMLAELEPGCGSDTACVDELFEILVGYYAAVGQEREASWLIALKTLPELPIPDARRDALRAAALEGADSLATLGALLETCERLDPKCFAQSRVASEVFLRAAARHGDAATLAQLAVLTDRAVDEVVFPTLVDIALTEVHAGEALALVESACEGRPLACATDARQVLGQWYEAQGWFADRRQVHDIDDAPSLGAYGRLTPAFMRVIRTSDDPVDAAARVEALCPTTALTCPSVLRDALADWYDEHNQLEAARQVRTGLRNPGWRDRSDAPKKD